MLDSKTRAQKRERKMAPQIGGRAHPGSGSVWYKKCDFSNAVHIVEDKYTDASTYSIKISILDKLHKQAHKIGKIPIFSFGFERQQMNYTVVSINDYNNYTPNTYYQLTTNKKSISMSLTGLSHLASQAEDIILAEITFSLTGKKYILLTWDDFVDNQSKFAAL